MIVDPGVQLSRPANEAPPSLTDIAAWIEALPDEPGKRIHCLFVQLYEIDTATWQDHFQHTSNTEFLDVFVIRFQQVYRNAVIGPLMNNHPIQRRAWHKYARLSSKLSMKSSIWQHLKLVIAATRAHVRYDIGVALTLAFDDHHRIYDKVPDIDYYRDLFFHSSNGDVFCSALLDFIDYHKSKQAGFRKIVLSLFSVLTKSLKFLWWPVLNSWRKAAWQDFEATR